MRPPCKVKTPAPSDSPTPVQHDAPVPVQPGTPAPAREDAQAPATKLPSEDLPPVLPEEPKANSPRDEFDMVLAQISVRAAARRVDVPGLPSSTRIKADSDQPTPSLSAMAGTAVLVAGGYRLVIGRSDRIRRRWSPVRFR